MSKKTAKQYSGLRKDINDAGLTVKFFAMKVGVLANTMSRMLDGSVPMPNRVHAFITETLETINSIEYEI